MRKSDASSALLVDRDRLRCVRPTFPAVLDGLGGKPLTQPDGEFVGFSAFMALTLCWRLERPLRTKVSLSLVSCVVSETPDDSDLEPEL